MTDETLKRANYLKDKIKELDFFIWCIERQRVGIVSTTKKLFLNALPYGGLSRTEIECGQDLGAEIYDVVCKHRDKLQEEYDSLS